MVKKLKKTPAKTPSKLDELKRARRKYAELHEVTREATNAQNRQKTAIKNIVIDILDENGANLNDAVVLDGEAIAYRPNASKEISPRTWHKWFMEKRISENQYFGALGVSVTEARKAIGEDQLPEVTIDTLSKSSDLRLIKITGENVPKDGEIIPFAEKEVPTSKEAKQRVVTASDPAPGVRKVKRKIRI